MYRTGQRFGVVHLTDVLTGKSTEKTRQFGHENLPTFGVGRDLSDVQWRGIFRQLTASGILEVDAERFGGLKLTAASKPVLKGEQPVTLRLPSAAKKAKKTTAARRAADNGITPADEGLWNALREARMRLAREQGVPPYVIFHDATLLAMLRDRPQTLSALGAISGVGERKLARYGEAFLSVLSSDSPD